MKSKVTSAIAEASRSLDTDFDVQITGRAVRNALHEHGMEPRNKINDTHLKMPETDSISQKIIWTGMMKSGTM
jgi:transposase